MSSSFSFHFPLLSNEASDSVSNEAIEHETWSEIKWSDKWSRFFRRLHLVWNICFVFKEPASASHSCVPHTHPLEPHAWGRDITWICWYRIQNGAPLNRPLSIPSFFLPHLLKSYSSSPLFTSKLGPAVPSPVRSRGGTIFMLRVMIQNCQLFSLLGIVFHDTLLNSC